MIEAASGAEGVRKAREEKPDVILLDMMMPTMDGSETLATLRSQPATAETPVIFLTAKAVETEVEHMRALGAAGVLIGRSILARCQRTCELCSSRHDTRGFTTEDWIIVHVTPTPAGVDTRMRLRQRAWRYSRDAGGAGTA